MTTNRKSTESQMLEQVRRWRREAYEADQSTPQADRHARLHEWAERYGLGIATRRTRGGPSDAASE